MNHSVKSLTELLARESATIYESYGVKSLRLFGSLARGEAHLKSDIDLVVEFERPVGLIGFLKFKHYLEDLLASEVDLATEGALHPQMKSQILKEAIRVA